MKILFVDQTDTTIPPPPNLIRASTHISVPLAEMLQQRGHQVYFLCAQGSKVNTNRIFTSTPPLLSVISTEEYYQVPDPALRVKLWWTFLFDLYYKLVEETSKQRFDLIHIHTNVPLLESVTALRISTPIVVTVHDTPSNKNIENRVLKLFDKKDLTYISISDYQRKSLPALLFSKTIYHGLDLKKFAFDPLGGSHFIFAGRFKKIKGLEEAIQIALRTNNHLNITGMASYGDMDFFRTQIKPLLEANKDLLHLYPDVDRRTIENFYQKGRAILIPILWEEPFGLTMIESMGCGTPVIAYARGSVPEIVKDGITGYIVNPSKNHSRGDFIIKKTGIDGLCEAVKRINSLPEWEYKQMRNNCRQHAEEHFSIKQMVDEYEKVYQKIIDTQK